MDGNFQLSRFRLKGDKWDLKGPQLQRTFFIEEQEVKKLADELGSMSTSGQTSSSIHHTDIVGRSDCGQIFKAGNPARTAGRTKAFDTSGIVGTVCRHGVPMSFLNIKTGGEKLIYAVVLLAKTLDISERVVWFYDIACVFKKYLKVCFFYLYKMGDDNNTITLACFISLA